MLQAITFYREGRQLLLKNPFHIARAKILAEMYPEAKFVFIHRNPYEVFSSTLHLWKTLCRDQMLQEFTDDEIREVVLYVFRTTLKGYLDQRKYIAEGNLVEIAYDELTAQPMETLQKIYVEGNLKGWEEAQPSFASYLESLNGYKRNKFTDLSREDLDRITEDWGFYFDAFGYEKR